MSNVLQNLRIAILQTGRALDSAVALHGDYDAMCKHVVGHTAQTAETFAVLDGHFPKRVEDYDVLVVTGSKHGVYEDHPWIAPLENLLRRAIESGVKIIGICFGHQILAQALGGVAQKSSRGLGVGLMDYEFLSPSGGVTLYKLYAWHQDQVIKAPPGSTLFARSAFCPIAGLRYGNQAISVQPHPEFSAAYMRALIDARAGTSIDLEQAKSARTSLAQMDDSAQVAQMFQQFLLGTL